MSNRYTVEHNDKFVAVVTADSSKQAWQIGISIARRNGWNVEDISVTETPELRSFKEKFAIKKRKRDEKLTKRFWDWLKE